MRIEDSSEVLDEVEHRQTVVITRHGRVIARISPDAAEQARHLSQTINSLLHFPRTLLPEGVTLRSLIKEGRLEDYHGHIGGVWSCSSRHQLTAYDAADVEWAVREGVPLVIFDAAMCGCASALKVKILPSSDH